MTLMHVPQVGDVILYRCCNASEQQAGTVTSTEYGQPGLVQVRTSHRFADGRPPAQVFAFVDVTDPRRDVEYAGREVVRTDPDGSRYLLVTADDEQPVHAGRELVDDEQDQVVIIGADVDTAHELYDMGDDLMVRWLTLGGVVPSVLTDPRPWRADALGLAWIEQPAR